MESEYPIVFKCPHRGAALAAKAKAAGEKKICPKCGKGIDVPKKSQSKEQSTEGKGS